MFLKNWEERETSKEAVTEERIERPAADFLEDFSQDEVQIKRVAAVKWEDITAYSRVEIPEDFEIFRLAKLTIGLLWKETEDYIVLVQDYDLTNRGRGYRHNDFHIIPRGTIKDLSILGEVQF